MNQQTFIIAGGGTGGHIYPGISIARALRQLDPKLNIIFVGTPAGLESKIVPKEGFALEFIQVGKLNLDGGVFGKIKTLLQIPVALWQSFKILRRLKPAAVLGVGGYASGPLVLMAALAGIRTSVWEANAYPGMTNRILGRFVDVAYLVFPKAAQFLTTKRAEIFGQPMRKEIEALFNQDMQSHADFNVLIFGGSQGARAINAVVKRAVTENQDWLSGIKIIHQTGSADFSEVAQAYQGLKQIEAKEYLHEMWNYYSWSDIIVSRAGAGTVTEVSAARKPAIFIPLPWAADDHQRRNAESLVEAGAAEMLLQSDLNTDTLRKAILRLKEDSQLRVSMREKLKPFFHAQAAEKIAEDLLNRLIKRRS